MKKLFPLGIFVIALASVFTSCKKEYNCVCTYYDLRGNITTQYISTIRDTHKKAGEKCNDFVTEYTNMGYVSVSCHI